MASALEILDMIDTARQDIRAHDKRLSEIQREAIGICDGDVATIRTMVEMFDRIDTLRR